MIYLEAVLYIIQRRRLSTFTHELERSIQYRELVCFNIDAYDSYCNSESVTVKTSLNV